MERRARLAAQIESLGEFGDLIRAMRAIAGGHVQEARDFLPGIRGYVSEIETGLVNAIWLSRTRSAIPEPLISPSESKKLVIAVCSEHGLCGPYSERILKKARSEIDASAAFGVVGRRGALLSEERGWAVDWTTPMVTHSSAVSGLCADLIARIVDYDDIAICYAQYQSGGQFEVAWRQLLPLDPKLFNMTQDAQLPIHQLSPAELLADITKEYVYSQLTHVIMEAFASENGARLQIMEAADRNIEGKVQKLSKQERVLRQEEVTAELLDIVTGAEAVMKHE